eukprot:6577678-Pyramimonas_sp.AAC.1
MTQSGSLLLPFIPHLGDCGTVQAFRGLPPYVGVVGWVLCRGCPETAPAPPCPGVPGKTSLVVDSRALWAMSAAVYCRVWRTSSDAFCFSE